MMRVAICDDEPIFVSELKEMLEQEFRRHGEKCEIVTSNRGEKLLEACMREKIDAVFLDIAMPGFDGFYTAAQLRKIREDIMIVFVSSKETTVFDTYEYNPIWFVPKKQMNLLKRAVDKIIDKSRKNNEQMSFQQVEMGNEVVEIDIRTIRYFKTDGHYINYYQKDGKKSKSFRCQLSDIEVQLEALWFVKTHNRYLVNLRAARCIEKNDIILHNEEVIPISRSQMNIVKEKFQDYYRSIR